MICGLWLILLKEKIVELHKTMIPPTKPSVSIMSKQSKGNPRAILSAFFWPMRSSVSGLPHEKEAVYRALDEWVAWELEFPMLAAAKALKILKSQRQWLRVIQVAKWMLSKGQGTTMATYDAVLLAFDKKERIDEAGSLWNMILHTHTRSISKRLFSRMISLYDHHDIQEKIIEVFADMEELGVKPDEDTVRRVARAFQKLGQEDKKNLVLNRYGCKWKYIHFKGERVRVRRNTLVDES
ncbi:pentatricopeptide repeat-containing protein At4g18975, chloroplastic isoform X2 [Spinacia oleracea]|uniref:Pentatricopeptide repeat-containing protein At4g18975, chloroplastic isoform X2 n=1 Tax=Spinacia oleracea TaxID=3562 RepID=A0A9R0INE4_SPIOL|nr:pentatricopeptide repeat-containing protein At4g18975, chloroplastic isoform X2 [Spinacia oleracea]